MLPKKLESIKLKSNHIVFTTIYAPHVLLALYENIARYGHLDSTMCWVVGDKKTPKNCAGLCQEVAHLGLETQYLDIASQDEWGKNYQEFYSLLPYNNETRRNIGYLKALEHGCERLISIDDDNYPTDSDFIGGHLNTGKIWYKPVIEEQSGFHNVCEYLEIEPKHHIFPRGFPFTLRNQKNETRMFIEHTNIQIGVTEGLWLREPDIDATTWVNGKIESKAFNGPEHSVLSGNTWIPINTQNTSIVRELIPTFLCIPMKFTLPGGKIERYGDIWGGYFLQALIANTPYRVSFGHPIVEHRRNPHNYLDDLRHEFWGIMLTDWLVSHLRESFHPSSAVLVDRVGELSVFLEETIATKLPSWCPPEIHDFMADTAYTLRLWAAICSKLL
jgi:hypothetical protein